MHRVYKGVSAVLAALVGTGCPVAEYGMPHATFDLDGTVVEVGTENGLAGMDVEFDGVSATTGVDGVWSIHHDSALPCDPCEIRSRDVNGEEGGVFQDGAMSFVPAQVEEGDGDWYEGAYEAHDLRLQMAPGPPPE